MHRKVVFMLALAALIAIALSPPAAIACTNTANATQGMTQATNIQKQVLNPAINAGNTKVAMTLASIRWQNLTVCGAPNVIHIHKATPASDQIADNFPNPFNNTEPKEMNAVATTDSANAVDLNNSMSADTTETAEAIACNLWRRSSMPGLAHAGRYNLAPRPISDTMANNAPSNINVMNSIRWRNAA